MTIRFDCTLSLAPFHLLLGSLLVVTLAVAGCDFLDPTEVENPRTTDEDLAQAEEPVSALLPGLRAQFAQALSSTVVVTEFASDNFSINGTGLGGNDLDFPTSITPNEATTNSTGQTGSYWNLQELRALADFMLEDIAPNDENATDAQVGEAHYYRGMAFLMQGENFVALPTEEGGDPVGAQALLQQAEGEFQRARSLGNEEVATWAAAALARTYRALGNAGEAASLAQTTLQEGGADFLHQQLYDSDESNDLDNIPHEYLVQRSLQEMQPLPRLDFLDPKYISEDAGIAVAKAEEMHLILAEVALADENPGTARSHMIDAINVAADRPIVEFNDSDPRFDNDLNTRPDTSVIEIAFEDGAPFVSGLVLNRPGLIDVPTVSATHITPADVTNADDGELTRLLYLLRQEILLLEGRRLHDLGIRLPMMLREIDTNPNINSGDTGTEVSVPSYIPSGNEMDRYTPVVLYDDNGNLIETQVTILHDMNRVLAEERGLVLVNPQLPGQ
jgi:hypothetical protein